MECTEAKFSLRGERDAVFFMKENSIYLSLFYQVVEICFALHFLRFSFFFTCISN